MKQTARLRLALYCAAAITATALGSIAGADQEGPPVLSTTPPAETERPAKGIKRDTYPFRGVIASIDVDAKRLTLEGKQTRRVIQVTDLTRFEKQGQPALFGDLKVGEAVGGTLKKTAAGHEQALLIRLGPKGVPAEDGANGPEPKSKTKPE